MEVPQCFNRILILSLELFLKKNVILDSGPDFLLGFLKGLIENPPRLEDCFQLPFRQQEWEGTAASIWFQFANTQTLHCAAVVPKAPEVLSPPSNSAVLHFLSTLIKHLPTYGGFPNKSTANFLNVTLHS